VTGRTPQDSPRLGRRRPLRPVPPNPTADQVTELRAYAQIAALRVADWPPYGSVDWLRLDPEDPRVYAGTLEAAELHRRAETARNRLDWLMEHEPVSWWREVTEEANREAARRARSIAARRTADEIRAAQARATNRPAREVVATPGWPPIQIPGRPGWHRHLINGEQVDRPTNDAQESSA